MKAVIAFVSVFLLLFAVGCSVNEKTVATINQKIADKYSSFSTLKFSVTDTSYQDGVAGEQQKYTETFKRPDQVKQVLAVDMNGQAVNSLFVCNGNHVYSQITPDLMSSYEYVNVPEDMGTYCNYVINNGVDAWKIPSEITNISEFDVSTSDDNYNGKPAVKAIVRVLMSDEEMQKQEAAGNAPQNMSITYWFDPSTLFILKEEAEGSIVSCENASSSYTGGSSPGDCKTINVKDERVYDGFAFDEPIADSDFAVNPADYPGVSFDNQTVDISQKLG